MKFRICTIGTGDWATYAHGPSFKKYAETHPDFELAACFSRREEKAIEYQQKFGFTKYYTNIEEMLNTEKPDAVCIILPVETTTEITLKVMEMGYPVILEKPPGLYKEETLKMIEVAERKNLINIVAFNRRFTPLIRKLRDIVIENHKNEEILNIACDFYRFNRKDIDFSSTAVHGIDTVKFLAGSDYKHIRFAYQQIPGMEAGVSNIFMDCVFNSGATAQLRFMPTIGNALEHYTVTAVDNSYFLATPQSRGEEEFGKLIHYQANKKVLEIDARDVADSHELYEVSGFYDESATFFEHVKAGKKSEHDIKSGLQTVEIAECIRARKAEYFC